MSPRHNPEASSTVMLPPPVCSSRLHSWREVTFTWRQWTVLSLRVKGEAAEQKQFSFTRFSWKLDPGAVSPSIIPLCASSWRGVPITYRHQEISSLKPYPGFQRWEGPAQEFKQSYTFQPLGLIMPCFCSPYSTWILNAYVVQKNSKEFRLKSSPKDMTADLAIVSRRCMANLWEQFLTSQKLIETRKETLTI